MWSGWEDMSENLEDNTSFSVNENCFKTSVECGTWWSIKKKVLNSHMLYGLYLVDLFYQEMALLCRMCNRRNIQCW